MQTGWVPYADLRAAALGGRLTDAHTMLAVLLAGDRGLLGSPEPRE